MRRNPSPCRFCGRLPGPGQHRAPGPRGPICADCLEDGLSLVRDGRERVSQGGTALTLAPLTQRCEFCDRTERRTFLGRRRPLARMACSERRSVICADCLDLGGDLLNRISRERTT